MTTHFKKSNRFSFSPPDTNEKNTSFSEEDHLEIYITRERWILQGNLFGNKKTSSRLKQIRTRPKKS